MRGAFDLAMDFVLRWEGGFVDHPSDPGGATNYGISIRFLRQGSIFLDLDRDGDMDAADMKLLPEATASTIYRDHFWLPLRCPDMPPSVAVAVMDTGVNMGVSVAAKFLQRALKVTADGKIGPVTLRTLYNNRDRRGLLVEYLTQRMKRYTELSTFSTFATGWTRRTVSCQDYCTGIELEG